MSQFGGSIPPTGMFQLFSYGWYCWVGFYFINVKFHPHLECDRFLKPQFFSFTLKMGKNNGMTSTDGMLTYKKKS